MPISEHTRVLMGYASISCTPVVDLRGGKVPPLQAIIAHGYVCLSPIVLVYFFSGERELSFKKDQKSNG